MSNDFDKLKLFVKCIKEFFYIILAFFKLLINSYVIFVIFNMYNKIIST